jgi:hypothetical protein
MNMFSNNVRESLTNDQGTATPVNPTHTNGVNDMNLNNTANVRDSLTNLPIAEFTPPASSVPSIASSAMLVELSVSHWTGQKKDRRASEDITAQSHADKGVANVRKKLLGNCAELEAVQKFVANSRNLHYSMTMPWSDTGMRLLPTAQYFKYHEQMTAIQNEFERLVDEFLQSYADEVVDAQLKLGSLFNPDDYPTTDALRCKFAFRLSYIPLPDAGDFRIDVGTDATEQLKTHYQSYYSNQLKSAMNDVWTRTYDALKHVSERLDYTDDNKKRYHNSLIPNLLDMVELLHVCNVTGDSQMASLASKLDDALRGVTTEAVKEDAFLRAQTKRAVDNVLKSLPSLDI